MFCSIGLITTASSETRKTPLLFRAPAEGDRAFAHARLAGLIRIKSQFSQPEAPAEVEQGLAMVA